MVADRSGRGPPPRWLGRATATMRGSGIEIEAGGAVPGVTVRLEAAAPQPPPSELNRELQVRLYRLGGAMTDDEPAHDAVSLPSSQPMDSMPLVRVAKLVVPSVPGERISMHDLDAGFLEKSGKFGMQISFVATRIKLSGNFTLETPPVEHRPLTFVVRPTAAATNQCKMRIRAPEADARKTTLDIQAEKRATADHQPQQLLAVCAGEPIVVSVLTRDRFCNATSVQAKGMVTCQLTLVESDDELRRLKAAAEPAAVVDADGVKTPPRSPPKSPPKERQAMSQKLIDTVTARYKGSGMHEAEFKREKAGRYVAAAMLRGETIPSGSSKSRKDEEEDLIPLSVVVTHGPVDPPSCRLLEVPQQHVDPRALLAAIERDRLANEHAAGLGGPSVLSMGEDASWKHETPACTPERTIGRLRLTANDRCGNRCNRKSITWVTTLVAREGWSSPDTPKDAESALPNGEAWVEPSSDGMYMVCYRGKAANYMLHVTDEQGIAVARSPYPVLIVPPAGGPGAARVHGVGARAGIAGDWSSFLMRPAEFMGCEPGPCDVSKSLFGHLRVAIMRRGEVPPAPWSMGMRSGYEKATDTAKATADSLTAESLRQSDATQEFATPKGSLVAQPPQPPKDEFDVSVSPSKRTLLEKSFDGARVDTSSRSSGPLMPPDAIVQKFYGVELGAVRGGDRRKRGARGAEGSGYGQPTSSNKSNQADPFNDNDPPPPIEPGAHLVRFSVREAGEYDIYVRYGKTELDESPFPVFVAPAPVSPQHSQIDGLAVDLGETWAGDEVTGKVLLRDRCCNDIVSNPFALSTTMRLTVEPIRPSLCPAGIEEYGTPQRIELHSTASEMPVEGAELCETQEEIDALVPRLGATFSFSLKVAGWYRVTAWVADEQVGPPHGTFPLLVHPRTPDPEKSRYTHMLNLSRPLPAGERFLVVATLRDLYGNVCAAGGHEVRATVRSPGEPVHSARAVPLAPGQLPNRGLVVFDRRDGAYEVHFTPMAVTKQTLEISMTDGADIVLIGGDPIAYQVTHGIPDPAHCQARGDGTRSAYALTNGSFFVDARDAAGNLSAEHAFRLTVTVTPAVHQQRIDIEDCGDGRHKVVYMIPVSGKYSLNVMVGKDGSVRPIDRRHVRGSPFNIFVHSTAAERAVSGDSPRKTASDRAAAMPAAISLSALDLARPPSPRRPQSARGASPNRASPSLATPRRPLSARGASSGSMGANSRGKPRATSTPRGRRLNLDSPAVAAATAAAPAPELESSAPAAGPACTPADDSTRDISHGA